MSRIVLFTALISANLASFEVLTPRFSTIAVYNGQIKGWGQNNNGQLVTGNTVTQSVPTDVFDLGPDSTGSDFMVDSIQCGLWWCCALSPAKDLKCWGSTSLSGYANSAYGNGIGDKQDEVGNIPLVTAVDNIVDMVAVAELFCVLMQQGGAFSLECVGKDYGGYVLGNGQTVTWDSGPVAVPGFAEKTAGWTDVKLGGGYWNLCVFDPNLLDALECWGAVSTDLWEEDKVAGRAFQAVNCGGSHCCALTVDQELTCWGLNSPRTDMSIIADFGPIKDFSTGFGSTCAISTSGRIGCFGVEYNGELGAGAWDIPSGFSASGVQIGSSGRTDNHYCIYEETATELLVECWGRNDYGQLGTDPIDLGWEVVPPKIPTADPTTDPTTDPTADPTADPTTDPTAAVTIDPSVSPTVGPTASSPATACILSISGFAYGGANGEWTMIDAEGPVYSKEGWGRTIYLWKVEDHGYPLWVMGYDHTANSYWGYRWRHNLFSPCDVDNFINFNDCEPWYWSNEGEWTLNLGQVTVTYFDCAPVPGSPISHLVPTTSPTAAPSAPPTMSPTAQPSAAPTTYSPTASPTAAGHYIAQGNYHHNLGEHYYCQRDDDNDDSSYSTWTNGIAVGCCSQDGNSGYRPDCNSHPATYDDAVQLCSRRGYRLCTVEEMVDERRTAGTGCSYDSAYQWTSDECTMDLI